MKSIKPKTAKPKGSDADRLRFLAGEKKTIRDPDRSGVELRSDGEEVRKISLYCPLELIKQIDRRLVDLGVGRQRSDWICEAIRRRLESEAADNE
jgi:hypothetical protein